MNQKIKKFIFVLIVLLVLTLIVGIIYFTYTHLNKNKSNNSDIFSKDYISQLGSANTSSVNYLLYNKDVGQLPITFIFKKNVKNYNVERVELLQDNLLVSKKVKTDDEKIDNNKMIIILSEYIKEFNKIRIYTKSGKTVDINVGQYYFDLFSIPENPHNKLALDSYHTLDLENSYEGNFEFVGEKLPKIELYIPDRFKGLNILQQKLQLTDSDNLNRYKYKYTCTIPKEYFKTNNLSTICFDLVFVDTTDINKKSTLITCNVVLTSEGDKK